VAWSYLRQSQALFKHANAAIMAPRSRRDKDMSDNKAIKQTIRVFRVVEFCISPGDAGQIICF
jgi:hypothetical protein